MGKNLLLASLQQCTCAEFGSIHPHDNFSGRSETSRIVTIGVFTVHTMVANHGVLCFDLRNVAYSTNLCSDWTGFDYLVCLPSTLL